MSDHEATSESADEVIARHRKGHEKKGTTMAVYFPPECPWDTLEQVTDQIAALAFDIEREGWDTFVFGRTGECTLTLPSGKGSSDD